MHTAMDLAKLHSQEFVMPENPPSGVSLLRRGVTLPSLSSVSLNILTLNVVAYLLVFSGLGYSLESRVWVERLAFWSTSELNAMDKEIANTERELSLLPLPARINSGNRNGFQSAARNKDAGLWIEVELAAATLVDSVVLLPLLGKGPSDDVAGFGFPKKFLLEGINSDGDTILLMDETLRDFPNPGIYPVSAICPPNTILQAIRLTVTEPWKSDGPALLALAEVMALNGNRNVAWKAKVRASSSREISPTWSRNNLVDMMTPLGLPVTPSTNDKVMGWQGPVATSIDEIQTVSVDLGKEIPLDEIRLVPAWRPDMPWDTYYGFPARFKIEISTDLNFVSSETVYDKTDVSLLSPGQNLQIYPINKKSARFIRITATRLRDRSGDYVFALGELQAYSGDVNFAKGAQVNGLTHENDPAWSKAGLTDDLAKGQKLIEIPEWIDALRHRGELERLREKLILHRSEVFTQAEHQLVMMSVGGTGSIILLTGLLSWRGKRMRVLDRERHRERLARDLHDELGSNLGSIALISSFAGQETVEQMRLDLTEIERVARESADSMRDMVSLLSGKKGGDAGNWLHIMACLAERLMSGVELDCRLPTQPLTWEPNLETRREIYLFCKEVIHNAAKHGHPTHLKFHLSPTAYGIRIEISDDGSGFDTLSVRSGHGLGNLRERASMMKAKLELTSSKETGTAAILDVPRGKRWTKT